MFLGGEMVWWPGDRIPSESGVRREVREREKIRGRRGRGREKRTRFFAPTPYLPHPSLFFLLASLCTVPQSECLEQAGTFTM